MKIVVIGGSGLTLPPVLFRPVAAGDVAAALAGIAGGGPAGGTVELAQRAGWGGRVRVSSPPSG